MKKKILITGGTGFLGSNLLDYFSKKKYKVFFTGRNILKGQEIEKKTKKFVQKYQEFSLTIMC